MQIVKLFKGKETEPRYYEFVREGKDHEKFAGHILVAYPLEKREAIAKAGLTALQEERKQGT